MASFGGSDSLCAPTNLFDSSPPSPMPVGLKLLSIQLFARKDQYANGHSLQYPNLRAASTI